MNKISKIIFGIGFIDFIFPHGVSKSTVNAMSNASILDFVYFGAEHMVTGYDHILFLIGVLFFLTKYTDIFKFITAFTIAHCITLIFATFFKITANAYLIDAVIAFSVIYKGFENLNGFKKYFSINSPNLILMVFIFGLIHGFGLSTKLQEVAALSNISLSLYQILSFNVGVELGQITALLIVYPILLILRKEKIFDKLSILFNWILIILGMLLLVYQLNGYFTKKNHNHITPNLKVQGPFLPLNNEVHNHNHDGDHHDH